MEAKRLSDADIPAISNTVAKVLMDATEASHLLKGISEKWSLVNAYANAQITYWNKTGEVWVIGDNQGMLAGHYGNKDKLLPLLWVNLQILKAPSKKDRGVFIKNVRASSGVQNFKWRKQFCGKSNYYFIDFIAIDPSLKGSGAFRKLIQPVLERSENEGIPVLLDTHDKNNVPIYQHFGFNVIHQFTAKHDEHLSQYAMAKV